VGSFPLAQLGPFRLASRAWAKAKFNKYVSGHLVAEYLAPGDFYADNRQDGSYFLRAELVLAY
jgi:hypothetical protein